MIGYAGDFCIQRKDDGSQYKVNRKGKRFNMFPMDVAVIAIDSHDNYVIYSLMYEPLIRGKGSEDEAAEKAREMQSDVEIAWERLRYIERCGVN